MCQWFCFPRFRQQLVWLLIVVFLAALVVGLLSSITPIKASWAPLLPASFVAIGVVCSVCHWCGAPQRRVKTPFCYWSLRTLSVILLRQLYQSSELLQRALVQSHLVGQEDERHASTRQCIATTLLTTSLAAKPSGLTRSLFSGPRKMPRLVVVSVTDVEIRAMLTLVPGAVKTVIQKKTYYDLGMLGQTHTYLVQATGMGPTGVRSSLEESIRVLAPAAIMLVGIAFGLQPHRQQIGDILLARQIQDYDPQKWGMGSDQRVVLYSRGNRMTATEWLLDRFVAGRHDWRGCATIQIGLLLSGSALIDHQEVCHRLLEQAPEAIGGEMEAATLCEVALHHHVDWIVVKAISDWADGTKWQNERAHQQLAAINAAQFVLHVIGQPGFWPGK